MTIFRWLFILVCLFTLALPLLADDDDDDTTLDPSLQWRLAESAWNRREYNEAASMMRNYATLNPDEPQAIQAWWYAYEAYRAHRPDKERRMKVYELAIAACLRWETKYKENNKNRVAEAMWYHANLVNNEGNRPQGIEILLDMVKRYPEAPHVPGANWTLGEWLRGANRYEEAISNYQNYRKVAGFGDQPAMAACREGWCFEALKDPENAALAYKALLNEKYNIGWGQVHWGLLDSARRLKKLGDQESARALLLRIIDKGDPNWDVTKQALAEMGEKPPMRIWVYPHFNNDYSSSNKSVDGRTKMTLARTINVLVRLSYVTKESPFKGTLRIIPKVEMSSLPANMPVADEDGKKVYTADIAGPDEKGNVQGDWWYKFIRTETATPPDGVTISRKWEKLGKTWGECTIRIQSTERWYMWIYLPNDKTNVNNLNTQPNEVRDAGKTFRWYNWYDLNQGMTIKFPVEIGANVQEFYPKIFLERWLGSPYPGKNGTGKLADYDLKEMLIKLSSDAEFPYTYSFPNYNSVTLNEIMN
ncbi:MAG: tetratricopeptide repeat protein [Armatimonadota bacterium]